MHACVHTGNRASVQPNTGKSADPSCGCQGARNERRPEEKEASVRQGPEASARSVATRHAACASSVHIRRGLLLAPARLRTTLRLPSGILRSSDGTTNIAELHVSAACIRTLVIMFSFSGCSVAAASVLASVASAASVLRSDICTQPDQKQSARIARWHSVARISAHMDHGPRPALSPLSVLPAAPRRARSVVFAVVAP